MRVTFSTTYDKMTSNIQKRSESIDRLSTSLTNGNRLQVPGDDPLAWASALDIKQKLAEYGDFKKNLDFAQGWNETTEDALNQMYDLITKARDIAVGSLKTTDTTDRSAYINQLNDIIEQFSSLADTKYGNRYIFGVNATQSLFSLNYGSATDSTDVTSIDVFSSNTNANVGITAAVAADLGLLDDTLEVRVGKGRTETVNVNGQEVFWEDTADPQSSIFQQLYNLKEAIRSNNTTTPTIEDQLGDLETAQDRIGAQVTLVGARLSNVEWQQEMLTKMKSGETERLADLADTDYAEAATQLAQKRIAYEAALKVTGMLKGLNLLSYV